MNIEIKTTTKSGQIYISFQSVDPNPAKASKSLLEAQQSTEQEAHFIK